MKAEPPTNFLSLAPRTSSIYSSPYLYTNFLPALERWDDGPEWRKRINKAAIKEWAKVLKKVAEKFEFVDDVEHACRLLCMAMCYDLGSREIRLKTHLASNWKV